MLQLRFVLLGLLLAFSQVQGHFLLLAPATVGFSDDDEGTAPCGGFSVSFDNATNFYVGGDSIALESTHPAVNWLFRATLDITAAGGWVNLLPVVAQTALGDFCEPSVHVPASYAGQKGVIQIVQNAVDGELFQCAAVNFVAGAAPSVPSVCKNATGVTATFTTDAALASLASVTRSATSPANSAATSAASTGATSATTMSATTSSAAAAATTSKSAAIRIGSEKIFGGLFWAAMGIVGYAMGL